MSLHMHPKLCRILPIMSSLTIHSFHLQRNELESASDSKYTSKISDTNGVHDLLCSSTYFSFVEALAGIRSAEWTGRHGRISVGWSKGKKVSIVGCQVNRLFELNVCSNSLEVTFNCHRFIKSSPIPEVYTRWDVLFESKFEMNKFMALCMQLAGTRDSE